MIDLHEHQLAAEPIHLLEADRATFRDTFDRLPFMFSHRLHELPFFDLSYLAELAEWMARGANPSHFALLGGWTGGADGAKLAGASPRNRFSESLLMDSSVSCMMKLSHCNDADPALNRLMHELLAEVEDLSGIPVRRLGRKPYLTIFVTPPGVVTPYHIDHESNFLFQIRGEKDMHLFDPRDREVLTEREIEGFYEGVTGAVIHRPEVEERGFLFRLAPGNVVHHPPLAPHWVKNRDNISVSLAFLFSLPQADVQSRIYKINARLRRHGVTPTPPGQSQLRDFVKGRGLGGLLEFGRQFKSLTRNLKLGNVGR